MRAVCGDAIRMAPGENHRENQHPSRDPNSFGFAVWQLKHGEEKIIADRLVGIFNTAFER